MAIFAEEDPKVLITYFLAFGIWTAAASNDFISSTWRPVRQTRQRGKLHVALAFIPMIFITVYVVFQHKTKDYKEMGAALLALAFAVLHLGQTFMGLWQLHVFKQWTIASVESMESLGYSIVVEEDESDDVDPDEDHDGFLQWLFNVLNNFKKQKFPRQAQSEIERFADNIKVNDTLIDNRLSDVHTVCSFRLLSKEENVIVRNTEPMVKRLCLRYGFRLWNSLRVVRVLWSLVFKETPRMADPSSGPRLIPLRPESVWLNWATALVAQAGWMLQDTGRTDPNPSPGYAEGRNRFAEQILLSASLHTQRMTTTEVDDEEKDKMTGLLSFRDWHNYTELCNGKFSKQEWLKRACQTGIGLPYGMRHRKAKVSKDVWGYGNFKSELLRAREALPPELETKVEGFDVKMLEWFTIFVSVKNWASWSSSEKGLENVEQNPDNSRTDSNNQPGVDAKDSEPENDIPIKNLKKQLGFAKEQNFIVGSSNLPFLRRVPNAILWGNRSILEISCHIDNWIALSAGEQTSYMLECVPWMENKLSLENAFREGSTDRIAGGSDAYCSIEQVVEKCAEFENYRFLCQMAIIQPELRHFDKSLTFLGCSMEMLRSSLAKWAEAHENCDEGYWKPTLFSDDVESGSSERGNAIHFDGTDDFTSCLRTLSKLKDMSKSFVKMRVIWELQNYLQKHAVAPSSPEAIALCILSFSALSVKVRMKTNPSEVQMAAKGTKESIEVLHGREECIVVVHDHGGEQFRTENYEYVIRSSCGPQDLQLIISFEALKKNSNVKVSILLCELEGRHVDYFDWEAWRNAFYGRLEGCRRWKQKVGIPNFNLTATSEHINAGVQKVADSTTANIPGSGAGTQLSVWKGWLPHSASICMYEMRTEGFILQAREIQGVPFVVTMTADTSNILAIAQEIWEPVSYSDAKPASLKNASLVAHDLLCKQHVLSAQQRTKNLLDRESDIASSSELRLLEVAAIQDRNPKALKALEKAVRILMHRKTQQAIRRGVALLERFYVFAKHGSCNLYLFLRKEEYVKTVKSLFEEIFKASDYDRVVAERYRLFLLLLMRYGPKERHENSVSVVLQSILHRCHSMEAAEATESLLSYYLSFHSSSNVEQVAVLVSAHSNAVNKFDDCESKYLQETVNMCLDIAVRALVQETGGMHDMGEFRISPHRMSELSERLIENGSSNAMSRLGGILEQGGHGIDPDIPQAVELYIKAIEKDVRLCGNTGLKKADHVGAISRLAPLMKKDARRPENEVSRVIGVYERLIEDRGNRHAINVLADFFSSGYLENVPRAMRLYERAISEHQDAHAMNMLGNLLTREDKGLKRDLPRAADLYCRAIYEGDHIYAMYNLAVLLYIGEIKRNIPEAIDLLNRSISEGGNVDAMYYLAKLLVAGADGVPKDVPRAAHLFSRAVKDGNHIYAMVNLAMLLCKGEGGIERNIPRAVDLLNRSIEQGNNFDAMNLLAILLAWGEEGLRKDTSRAMELFSRAIDEGKHSYAMLNLGVLYCSGEGVEKNVPRGIDLLSRAADECGNVDAMNVLAGILEKGDDGVEKDIPRAVQLYSRAVEEGRHQLAMYHLGALLCGDEEGVERDVSRAADLFNLCITVSEDVDAMIKLADLLQAGRDGVSMDLPRAIELYERAVNKRHSIDAMVKLGDLLQRDGDKLVKNIPRAVEFYVRAAIDGSLEARQKLAILQSKLEGVQEDHHNP